MLCRLAGMDSRNIRKDRIFRDVKAVDLGDYDGDGTKEIVTICEYEITGEGRQDGREARIYRFDEDGIPCLDEELTAKINDSVSELSLSGIAHYIKNGKDREKFGGRFEAYAAEVAEADPDSYNRFALIYVNDDRFPELLEWGTSRRDPSGDQGQQRFFLSEQRESAAEQKWHGKSVHRSDLCLHRQQV